MEHNNQTSLMSLNRDLQEKWIKASIIGTIWAASEIVLGSFLHNLNIPFSGNILTGIGLIILISVDHLWSEKGLFWRAGLLTALLKTLSPSAFIFGPMIAIITEAVLLEFSIRILGRTTVGYVIGAVLAMSWNLIQTLINYILFYGYNIVTLYTNLIQIAQKQIGIRFDILWLPVLVLLAIHIILGAGSAAAAIKIGRKLREPSAARQMGPASDNYSAILATTTTHFHYSMIWLAADILAIVGALSLLAFTDWPYWSLSISSLVIVWARRYKRVLRQLAKPQFWLSFIVITMLTASAFTRDAGLEKSLLIGLQMNFRAAVIILGLAVLGTEFYNPVIRNFFLKSSFKQLSLALELSLESLPSAIANLPDVKEMIKNPVLVLERILAQAENRLAEIKNKTSQCLFIISGAIGQGKTLYVRHVVRMLQEANLQVCGFYSDKIIKDGVTVGYDLVETKSGDKTIFLRTNGKDQYDKIGDFYIYPAGLQKGRSILHAAKTDDCEIIIIDEVGKLELENKGWAVELDDLLHDTKKHLLLTVRDRFVGELLQRIKPKKVYVFNIAELEYQTIAEMILANTIGSAAESIKQDRGATAKN